VNSVLDVKIYLKSGNVVEFAAKSLRKKHGFGEMLVELCWENLREETQLFYLNLDCVAAITITERPVKQVNAASC